MNQRTLIYVRTNGTEPELSDMRQIAEGNGDTVIGSFSDDPTITGKGKYAGWRQLLARLEGADMVIVGCAADLPGQTVADLLKVLSVLNGQGVGLWLHHEGINTDDGAAAILDLIASYRAAKLSEAIRRGIEKARLAGKVIGRPRVPDHVRRQITIAWQSGAGIRPTARRFKVSAASILNIARETSIQERQAA